MVEGQDGARGSNPAEIDKLAAEAKTKSKQGDDARNAIASLNKSGKKAGEDDEDEESEGGEEEPEEEGHEPEA
jgi:hypothetical protein